MNLNIEEIFAAAPSPYVLLDRELRIVWANRAYLEVTGRSRERLIGRILTEEFPADPESRSDQMLRASFRRVFETGEIDHLPLIPYPIKDPDGTLRERQWSATHTPIRDADGGIVFVLQNTFDVTELYQDASAAASTEQAAILHRAEAVARHNLELGAMADFLRTVFEQAPSFIAILNGPDHQFRMVNEAYRRLVGNRRLEGLTVRDALPEVEGQGFVELLDQVYRTGEPVSVRGAEVLLKRGPAGTAAERRFVDFIYQPLKDADGRVSGIMVEGHDVTAQKEAERQLELAEERFRTMAQSLPAHIWTADPQGNLDWLSDPLYAYTGARRGELLGPDWIRALHPEDVPRALPVWQKAISTGAPYETEFRIRRHDGAWRWHLVRATAVRDAEGRILRWVGSNTDIEDRKATESALAELNATLEERVEQRNRELQEAQESLRQSQKMEAIGTLAGGIAHDFNNLLQAISGSLQLALRDMGSDAAIRPRLENAMRAVDRGAKLASQLLSFGRRQPLAPRAASLATLLEEMESILRSAVGEGVRIETEIDPELWPVLVDRHNIESAILNLAVNARDAMDGHGTLSIAAQNRVLGPRDVRTMPDVSPGEYVCLSIGDTGRGMDAETLAQVFEPFFTTKPAGKGTGLGMAMVYGFAKQSGGHVEIASRPGDGTTVTLLLPRAQRGEVFAHRRAETRLAPASGTVLLVEDDEAVRLATAELLRDLGYQVQVAPDADHGLRLIEEGARIDALVTDVVMPGRVTSRELAERAQALLPRLAVLFTTGYARADIVENGRLTEGVHLLRKPYTQETLARRLSEVLAQAQTAAPPPPQELRRVLICEDDALIRMDLADMMRERGAEVVECGDGTGALRRIREGGFDLLMVDVGLPDISGEELARQAVEALPGLPVVFVTGHAEVPLADLLPRAAVLSKPFAPQALEDALTRLMDQSAA